jgi:SAM-dependent methyltransferase
MTFKDHFSGHAGAYAAARPHYPPELFAWLAKQSPLTRMAWDAGTGNGQAAIALAAHFEHVIATEPSAAQVDAAEQHPRVEYRVEPAEAPTLDDASVDLVTVAQAMHWFDLERFHASVKRVLAPRGVIAVWTYGLSLVDAAVDREFMHLYDDVLGAYWPPERRHVENGYADLAFPYEVIDAPEFAMTCEWTLAQYLAYLRTWSATARYQREHGGDPVANIAPRFEAVWGDEDATRTVRWPLRLRVGRVS